jgi:hypothetical protein
MVDRHFYCNQILTMISVVSSYNANSSVMKKHLIRRVTSLVANAAYNLGVFCNLIPSDIWPDKRGGLLDTPVSSTNKTGCHDITEILLKVALNPITVTLLMM